MKFQAWIYKGKLYNLRARMNTYPQTLWSHSILYDISCTYMFGLERFHRECSSMFSLNSM